MSKQQQTVGDRLDAGLCPTCGKEPIRDIVDGGPGCSDCGERRLREMVGERAVREATASLGVLVKERDVLRYWSTRLEDVGLYWNQGANLHDAWTKIAAALASLELVVPDDVDVPPLSDDKDGGPKYPGRRPFHSDEGSSDESSS